MLNRHFLDYPEAVADGLQAFLASSNELKTMKTNTGETITQPAISVYCYRISVDKETRPGWSAVGSADGVPRLPLRMHLLLASWRGRTPRTSCSGSGSRRRSWRATRSSPATAVADHARCRDRVALGAR